MARHLRKGEFLAYVGQYAYLVDCFSTSTDWEYGLFQTDDALTPTTPTAAAGTELDAAWPTTPPTAAPALDADADVAGWLASTRETP